MKLVSLAATALALSVLAPAPSHAAAVDTIVADAETGAIGTDRKGLWVGLHSEDPRCEHGRVVRLETRNPGQPWKTIGQDTTKQTSVAAIGYEESAQKADTRFVVVASTLADGTVCRTTSLHFASERTLSAVGFEAPRGPGGVFISPVGFLDLDFGRILFAGLLHGSPGKCLPNRLVIHKINTFGGYVEVARDTTGKFGVFGYDYVDTLSPQLVVVPRKVLADGTVCPRLEAD